MSKKCIYCKNQLEEEMLFDVCEPCGYQVWGPKMYQAILQNMKEANNAGDLYQGTINANPNPDKKKSSWQSQSETGMREMSFVSEAKSTLKKQEENEEQSIYSVDKMPSASIPQKTIPQNSQHTYESHSLIKPTPLDNNSSAKNESSPYKNQSQSNRPVAVSGLNNSHSKEEDLSAEALIPATADDLIPNISKTHNNL